MQLKQLFVVILFFETCCAYAQQPYYNQRPEYLKANSVWAFGQNAGLDFNNGDPQGIHTEIKSVLANSVSVADPITGKLLFYTLGDTIWNANHQPMPFGNLNQIVAAVVRIFNNSNVYYLITKKYLTEKQLSHINPKGDSIYTNVGKGTLLYYSVIDMTLNNGYGDVVVGERNIQISSDTIGYDLIAIPGECEDVWLMAHAYNSASMLTYRISKTDIDTMPIVSNISKPDPEAYLYVSPDRKKIATIKTGEETGNIITFGAFNAKTGKVSDMIRVPGKDIAMISDVCFSPDNSKLYLLGAYSRSNAGIFQYDLSNFNSTAITASEQLIAPKIGPDFYRIKLYNDTAYVFKGNSSSFIHRINRPNLSGIACDYQADAIQLLDSTFATRGLNVEVVSPLPLDTLHALALDTTVCTFDLNLDAPSGYEHYQWDDESIDPNRTVSEPGKYWVLSISDCGYRVDTFIVTHEGLEAPVINANGSELFTTATFFSYQWIKDGAIIPNATGSKYNVLEEGDYQVIVSNAIGCTDTSEIFKVEKETHIPGSTDLADLAKQIRIYPNPATDLIRIDNPAAARLRISLSDMEGRGLFTANHAELIPLKNLAKGIYLMRIMDEAGNLIKVEKVVKQ